LVPNGSFEDFLECPEDYSTQRYLNQVSQWYSPNAGTPDYFNSCSYKCGVPLNWVGSANAYHGNAYMGIIACMQQIDPHQIAYREYLQVELADSLKKGSIYFVSFQVQLGLSCNIACNGLGIFFSKDAMLAYETVNFPIKADVLNSANNVIKDKNKWTQICGTFVAHGNEKFVTIGNFYSNQEMQYQLLDENLIVTPHINPMAYYYIDDVQVLLYNDSLKLACSESQNQIPVAFKGYLKKQTKMVLEHLYFETDKSIILKESYYELDNLVSSLRRNNTLKISICGHTDNTGNIAYNQLLSEQRALAVKNYLISKGVSKFRISTQGKGDSQPISNNQTDEGKQLNRRVEIEVY